MMLLIYLVLGFSFVVFNSPQSIMALHVTEKFLATKNYDHLVICSHFDDDLEMLAKVDITQKHDISVNAWDCQRMISMNNALIFLDEPKLDVLVTLFNQPEAQKTIKSNTWLIRTKNSSIELAEYFKGVNLKIGLNAKIFISIQFNTQIEIHQALGTGTSMPKFQVI